STAWRTAAATSVTAGEASGPWLATTFSSGTSSSRLCRPQASCSRMTSSRLRKPRTHFLPALQCLAFHLQDIVPTRVLSALLSSPSGCSADITDKTRILVKSRQVGKDGQACQNRGTAMTDRTCNRSKRYAGGSLLVLGAWLATASPAGAQ